MGFSFVSRSIRRRKYAGVVIATLAVRKTRVSFLLALIFINNWFVLFSKIVSPQWILWDLFVWLYLVKELSGERRMSFGHWLAFIVPNALSYLYFPMAWDLLRARSIYFLEFAVLIILLRCIYVWLLLRWTRDPSLRSG
jgi:hypothetical protein